MHAACVRRQEAVRLGERRLQTERSGSCPAKTVLAGLDFRDRRPKSDSLLAKSGRAFFEKGGDAFATVGVVQVAHEMIALGRQLGM
jgi:hypothetical protein